MENLLKNRLFSYILISLIIFYTIANLFTMTSQDNIINILTATTEKKKEIFDHWLQERLNACKYAALYPYAFNIIQKNKDSVLKPINSCDINKVYDIFYVDLNGKIITSNNEQMTNFHIDNIMGSLSDYDIDFESDENDIRYSAYYNDYVIDMYAPVYKDNKLFMLVVETVSVRPIQDLMKKVSRYESENTYIVNNSGKILVGYDDNIIDKNIKESDLQNLITNTTNMYLDYNDIPVYGYATFINENNWILIDQIPQEDVVNTNKNIRSFFIKSWTCILAILKLVQGHKAGEKGDEK